MNYVRCICGFFAAVVLAIGVAGQTAPANIGSPSSHLPPVLQNVGFEPPLNGQLPLDLHFRDETGADVRLGNYFGSKPVLLALVYYGCPMLCNQVEQGVVGSLRMLSFTPGRDYQVVFVSFDPSETATMAAKKKDAAISRFGRPETAAGWHFLTGTPDAIQSLTHAANFRYYFDPAKRLFAHASGIMLLTPDGRVSRYFYGVEYPARDVRLGLVDASAGKIGTPIDHLLLYCFEYDPSTARYSATVLRLVRLGGLLTVFALVGGIIIFRRRDLRNLAASSHSRQHDHSATQGAH